MDSDEDLSDGGDHTPEEVCTYSNSFRSCENDPVVSLMIFYRRIAAI